MKHVLVFLILLLVPLRASAHGFSPSMLDIVEEAPRRYRVSWTGEGVPPVFEGCRSIDPLHFECERDLAGTTLRLSGLSQSKLTAIVRFVPLGSEPSFVVAEGASDVVTLPAARPVATTAQYLKLGVEHVLSGLDHLLFVACLAAWVRKLRPLLWVLTAFTVAHSVTLAAAVLGVIHVPQAPVEVCIAASVLLIAAEVARRSSQRSPRAARVAFAAGLLHGLGFAGALGDVGLPRDRVASALIAFNVGVELGQLAFVVGLALIATLVRGARVRRLAITAAGCAAAYMFIERSWALVAG